MEIAHTSNTNLSSVRGVAKTYLSEIMTMMTIQWETRPEGTILKMVEIGDRFSTSLENQKKPQYKESKDYK